MVAQENTIFKWAKKFDESIFTPKNLELLKKLTVIRLDFVATIKIGDGEYKKVLIKIQKARETSDIMRFRTYIAEQYKCEDTIIVDNKTERAPLPIITIYLLAFNLQESTAIVHRVGRTYHDMIEDKPLNVRIPFIEYLTHDCYVVQLGRITGKLKSRLENVLSVFEQRYFIDTQKKISKKYPHVTNDQVVRLMLEILEHANADPDLQAKIEEEWISYDILSKLILEQDEKINKKDKEIATKDKEIATMKKEFVTMKKEFAELKRQLTKLPLEHD